MFERAAPFYAGSGLGRFQHRALETPARVPCHSSRRPMKGERRQVVGIKTGVHLLRGLRRLRRRGPTPTERDQADHNFQGVKNVAHSQSAGLCAARRRRAPCDCEHRSSHDASGAGASPKIRPVPIATQESKSPSHASRAGGPCRRRAVAADGSATSRRGQPGPAPDPATLQEIANTMASVSNCVITRRRDAPMATRIDISRFLPAARASNRFAM